MDRRKDACISGWMNEWMNKPEKECDLVTWSTKQPERSSQLHLGSSPPTQKSGAAFILHSTELYKSRFWLHVWNGILYFLLLGISFPHSLKRGSSLACLVRRCDCDTLDSMSPPRPEASGTGHSTGASYPSSCSGPSVTTFPISVRTCGSLPLSRPCPFSGVQLGPATQRPEAWWLINSFHRQKTHVS